jgi:hypothetical protein
LWWKGNGLDVVVELEGSIDLDQADVIHDDAGVVVLVVNEGFDTSDLPILTAVLDVVSSGDNLEKNLSFFGTIKLNPNFTSHFFSEF